MVNEQHNNKPLAAEEFARLLGVKDSETETDPAGTFHYKGIFVDILREFERTRKPVKISSFTHRNIQCRVEKNTASYVILRSLVNNKRLFLAQASIKDIEEI